MRKWLTRFLLCFLIIIASWVGYIYNCACQSKQYNVVVEGTSFGHSWVCSGVIISGDGLILTAGHCCNNVDSIRITLPDGQLWIANEYYFDENEDVGLIDLPIETENFISLANSDDIKSGNVIYNIGNANGIWDNSIFWGIVFKNHFKRFLLDEDSEFIMARMTVYPGCSGGGVYHYNKFIGIVVMKGYGATFIVSSNTCKEVIERYKNSIKEN